jgi:hypothetical protein
MTSFRPRNVLILCYIAVTFLSIFTTAYMAARLSPVQQVETYRVARRADIQEPTTVMPISVVPYEARKGLFFLQNPLHLFYPYRTSEDDMRITTDMQAAFAETIQGGIR